MNIFRQLSRRRSLHILGLMSGTSGDGLDIALVACSQTGLRFLAGDTFPYTADQRQWLLNLIQKPQVGLAELSQANFYLARLWAGFVRQFSRNHPDLRIDLIGSHGQTLWHQPIAEMLLGEQVSSTLQIGDPAVLAQLTGLPVIGDFRVADVARGGQGAPLIPYFDWKFFTDPHKNRVLLNIGGISNVTLLPAGRPFSEVRAFDTGPGNMLIDALMLHYFQQNFDRDGQAARSGKLSDQLLREIYSTDSFQNLLPPKSTGREQYNNRFTGLILSIAAQQKISAEDVIHTVSVYTAATITGHLRHYFPEADEVLVSGGGACNPFLMTQLSDHLKNCSVRPVDELGFDAGFKEAMAFALYAWESLHGRPVTHPGLTGADRPVISGKWCPVDEVSRKD